MKKTVLTILSLLFAANLWAASATDNFNIADGALSGNWTTGYTASDVPVILSNHVAGNPANAQEGIASYNALLPGADQFSQVTLAVSANTTWRFFGVNLRMAVSPTNTYYLCIGFKSPSSNTSWITINNAGSETILASESATTWVVSDLLKCTVAGTTLTLFRNGSQLLTITDSVIASGRLGINIGFANSVGGLAADIELDDWVGGDGTGPAVAGAHRRQVSFQ